MVLQSQKFRERVTEEVGKKDPSKLGNKDWWEAEDETHDLKHLAGSGWEPSLETVWKYLKPARRWDPNSENWNQEQTETWDPCRESDKTLIQNALKLFLVLMDRVKMHNGKMGKSEIVQLLAVVQGWMELLLPQPLGRLVKTDVHHHQRKLLLGRAPRANRISQSQLAYEKQQNEI